MAETLEEEYIPSQGYIHGLKDGIDIKRLIIAYPIHKVLADIYKPLSFNGSLLQDKTSDIEYPELPYKENLEVIVTNLEHYGQSDVIYESFEEDKTLLKILSRTGEVIDLPNGTKVIVKDKDKNNHKSYVVDETSALRSVLGKIVAVQYELTPIYLANQTDNLLLTAKRLKESLESGAILEDDGSAKELSPEDKIELVKEFTEEEVLILDKKGGIYYE